ncbi:MAG: hypothetical protein HY268_25055 [Deltaproteobacteria bacterium]|nr:hypothetical protein [Deltaproteobacteria bacterium]
MADLPYDPAQEKDHLCAPHGTRILVSRPVIACGVSTGVRSLQGKTGDDDDASL